MWSNIPMKNLIAFVFLGTALPLFAQPYKFQVIEPFLPDALNDEGVVVGHIGAPVQGVFRFNEFITNVNDPSVSGGQTALNGVNNQGEIVGTSDTGTGGFVRGFLLQRGVYQTITVPGGDLVNPAGINNAGHIVGSYSVGANNFGFILRGSALEKLANPASGINDHGDIVGNLPNGTGYLLKNGVTTPIVFPGAASTFVSGINNAGTIVGFTSTGSFVLKDGVFTTIRFPADAYFGYVNGINNSGQITGFSIGPRGLTAFIGTPVR
jgi:hypothetical protein